MLTLVIAILCSSLCLVYCLYARWKSKQPWPDFGGRVTELSSYGQWDTLVDRAAAENLIVVVDLFALWCPPCRRAAPVYAKMSEEMMGAVFAKVNVDKSPELAALLGARALPTFKLFRSTPLSPLTNVGQARKGGLQELEAMQGWDEKQLRYLLELHGAGAIAESEKARLLALAST